MSDLRKPSSDKELGSYERVLERVVGGYRSQPGADASPPSALDAVILAMAKNAIAEKKPPQQQNRWLQAVAALGIVTLSGGFMRQLWLDRPNESVPVVSTDAAPIATSSEGAPSAAKIREQVVVDSVDPVNASARNVPEVPTERAGQTPAPAAPAVAQAPAVEMREEQTEPVADLPAPSTMSEPPAIEEVLQSPTSESELVSESAATASTSESQVPPIEAKAMNEEAFAVADAVSGATETPSRYAEAASEKMRDRANVMRELSAFPEDNPPQSGHSGIAIEAAPLAAENTLNEDWPGAGRSASELVTQASPAPAQAPSQPVRKRLEVVPDAALGTQSAAAKNESARSEAPVHSKAKSVLSNAQRQALIELVTLMNLTDPAPYQAALKQFLVANPSLKIPDDLGGNLPESLREDLLALSLELKHQAESP